MKFAYVCATLAALAYATPRSPNTLNEDGLAIPDTSNGNGPLSIERHGNGYLPALHSISEDLEEHSFQGNSHEEIKRNANSDIPTSSAQSFLNALRKIASAIEAVTRALNRFGNNEQPTSQQALAVQKAGAKVNHAFDRAFQIAWQLGPVTKADKEKMVSILKNEILPSLYEGIQEFIDHAPGFEKGGYLDNVRERLNDLKRRVLELFDLIRDLTDGKVPNRELMKLRAQASARCNRAIRAYQ